MSEFVITKIEGAVYRLDPSGEKTAVKIGDVIDSGTEIITEDGASAEFSAADGSSFDIPANTDIVLGSAQIPEAPEVAAYKAAADTGALPDDKPEPQQTRPAERTISGNSDMHSFVQATRVQHGEDLNLSYARDVNETANIEGRASLNPRIKYSYNTSLEQEVQSYKDPRFPFDGGHSNQEGRLFEPERVAADEPGAPAVKSMTASTDEDTVVTLDPNDGFTIPQGVVLTLVSANADYGTVQLTGGKIVYTPNDDYHDSDTVTYSVTDQSGHVYTGATVVEVRPVADTVDDADIVTENSSVDTNVLANDKFADLPGAKVVEVSQGEKGSVEINADGTVKYTPAVDWLADGETTQDTYTYTVLTAAGNKETATVTITITGTNDAPVVTAITGAATEDGTLTSSGNVINEHTTDLDTTDMHTIIKVNDSADKVGQSIAGKYGNIVIKSDGSYEYTLNNGTNGDGTNNVQTLKEGETHDEIFNVTVSDGHGGETTQDITITVNGTNDTPTAENNASSVVEDTQTTTSDTDTSHANGNILANDNDIDNGHTLHIAQVKGSADKVGSDVTGDYGTVKINSDGTYTYNLDNTNTQVQALAVGEHLTDTFDIVTTDEKGATVNETLTITITGTNDAPEITLAGTDKDTSSLTETDSPLSDSGTLTLTDIDTTNTVTTVKVDGVTIGGTYTGPRPTDSDLINMFTTDGTIDNASTTEKINWHFNTGTETFDKIPDGKTLVLTYAVKSTDSSGASTTHDVKITITGTEDLPILRNDAISITELSDDPTPGTVDGNVTTNDGDLDYGEDTHITVTNISKAGGTGTSVTNGTTKADGTEIAGTYGKIKIGSDGTYTYTLDNTANSAADKLAAGDVKTDVFTVTAKDIYGGSKTETLTVTVNGVNDTPTAVVNASSVVEDTQTTTSNADTHADGNILDNDDDVDNGHTLHIAQVAGSADNVGHETTGTYGKVTINSDGTYTYNLDNTNTQVQALAVGEHLTDTFNIVTTDEHGATVNETLTITITGTNDNPTLITAAAGAVTEDTTGSMDVSGTLTRNVNFEDSDATDTLTMTGIKAGVTTGTIGTALHGTYGTLTMNSNGSYSYTLDEGTANASVNALKQGEKATDTFTATVSDGNGGTVEVPVNITVTGTNDTPVATNNSSAENTVKAVIEDSTTANVTTGNVLTSGTPDSDVDHNAVLTVQDIKFGSGETTTVTEAGTVVNGTYGSVTIHSVGSYTYTLDNTKPATDALTAGQNVDEVFNLTIKDEHGATDTSTLTIKVQGANDLPVAKDDSVTIDEDFNVAGNVITGGIPTSTGTLHAHTEGVDTDVDTGETSQLKVTSFKVDGYDTTHTVAADGTEATITNVGTITMKSDGSYTFTPDENYSGSVPKITYTVEDPHGATATADLNITVNPVADAPAWTPFNAVSTPEDKSVAMGLKLPDEASMATEKLGYITVSSIDPGVKLCCWDADTKSDLVKFNNNSSSDESINIVIVGSDRNVDTTYHYSGLSTEGAIKLTADEFKALKILPPTDSGKTVDLDFSTTSYEIDTSTNLPKTGVTGNTITNSLKVDVSAVTDDVNLGLKGIASGSYPENVTDWSVTTDIGTGTSGGVKDTATGTVTMNEDTTINITPLLKLDIPKANANGGDGDTTDSSEDRWLIIKGLPEGTTVKIGDSSAITVTADQSTYGFRVDLTNDNALPDIKVTPPTNYNNVVDADSTGAAVSVTLHAQDSDGDTTVTTNDITDTVNLNLKVTPVAGEVKLSAPGADIGGIEDVGTTQAVKFLSNLKVTDTNHTGGNTEQISSVAITVGTENAGWTFSDGNHSYTVAQDGTVTIDGSSTNTITFSGLSGDDAYTSITATPSGITSQYSGTLDTLPITVTTTDGTVTGDKTFNVPVVVLPVADSDGLPTDMTTKIAYSDGTTSTTYGDESTLYGTSGSPITDNTSLTMNGSHQYSTGVSGTEDSWFKINQDSFDLSGNWSNQDTSDSSEETYALLKAEYVSGIDGKGNAVTAGDTATGASFRYYTGTASDIGTTSEDADKWVTVNMYSGTNADAVKIPSEYLATVQFKAPGDAYGQFKIVVNAYTVDTTKVTVDDKGTTDTADDLTATYTSTAVSGEALLTNVTINPQADPATLAVSSPVKAVEDASQIVLDIRPTSSTGDPHETFNVTIKDIPDGCKLYYDGTEQTITNGSAKITNFDSTKTTYIVPKTDSNVDFDLSVSTTSVVTYGTYSNEYTTATTLPITIDLTGVPDAPTITLHTAPSVTEVFAETNGIALSNAIISAVSTDSDSSETLTLRITGLDSKFSLTGATVAVGGTGEERVWLVKYGELSSVKIATPDNYSGDVHFIIQPTVTESDGASKTWSTTEELVALGGGLENGVTIKVKPTPEATINLAASALEDKLSSTFVPTDADHPENGGTYNTTHISFDIQHQNGDTDETLSSVLINKADLDADVAQYTLYYSEDGGTTRAALSEDLANQSDTDGITLKDGYYELTGDAINYIYAQGASQVSGEFNFGVKYMITDSKYGDADAGSTVTNYPVSSGADSTYTFTVSPVTDQTSMATIHSADINVQPEGTFITNVSELTDFSDNGTSDILTDDTYATVTVTGSVTDIPVTVTVNPSADTDGSEKMVQLIVDGVPDGVSVTGGTYIGDTTVDGTNSSANGRWIITVDSESITADKTYIIHFDVDSGNRSLWRLNGETLPIKVTAVSQDTSGTVLADELASTNGAWWDLKLDFPTGGQPYDWPPTGLVLTPGVGTVEDSCTDADTANDATLWDIVKVNYDTSDPDYVAGRPFRFSITLKGIHEGTEIQRSGELTATTVGTDGTYTISGYGNDSYIESLFKNISVKLPANDNDNNLTTTVTADWSVQGEGQSSGVTQTGTGVSVDYTVTPVTDDLMIAATTPNGTEYSETVSAGAVQSAGDAVKVPLTVSLTSEADGTHASLIDGKVYFQVSGGGSEGKLLDASGTELSTVTVSNDNPVSGLTNGTYYVVSSAALGTDISLQFQPTKYWSGTVNLTTFAVSQEENATNTATAELSQDFTIAAVNSGVVITTPNAEVSEDAMIILKGDNALTDGSGNAFSFTLNDTDTSEHASSVTIGNVPDGFLVYTGSSADGTGAVLAQNMGVTDGKSTWLVTLTDGALPAYIAIKPAENWSGALTGDSALNISVFSGEGTDALHHTATTASLDVAVNALADGLTIQPTLSFNATPSGGTQNAYTDINLNASIKDTDGSETATVTLKGLGDGTTFMYLDGTELKYIDSASVSYNSGNDTYTLTGLTSTEINNLKMYHVTGSGTATANAWTVESSNSDESDKTGSKTFIFTATAPTATANSDVILYKGDVGTYNGLGGDDTLIMPNFHGDNAVKNDIDFSADGTPTFQNIETIDLTSGDHTLSGLSAEVVKNMTDDDNTLIIKGGSGDRVNMVDADWTVAASTMVGFAMYTNAAEGTTLFVQDGITDDVLTYSNSDVTGGVGNDVLQFGTTDSTIDFSTVADKIHGVDTFDLSDASHALNSISPTDVYNMTDGGELTIHGDAGDSLTTANGAISWESPTLSSDGSHYTYTSTGDFDHNAATPDTTVSMHVDRAVFDDTLSYNAGGTNDGGLGNDTLTFGSGNSTVNFGDDAGVTNHISNIETFDLTTGDHTLDNLSAKDVLDMTDARHTLTINGDGADHVNLSDVLNDSSDGGWENVQTSSVENGHTYDVYTGSYDGQTVTLKIEDEIIKQLTHPTGNK